MRNLPAEFLLWFFSPHGGGRLHGQAVVCVTCYVYLYFLYIYSYHFYLFICKAEKKNIALRCHQTPLLKMTNRWRSEPRYVFICDVCSCGSVAPPPPPTPACRVNLYSPRLNVFILSLGLKLFFPRRRYLIVNGDNEVMASAQGAEQDVRISPRQKHFSSTPINVHHFPLKGFFLLFKKI